MNNYCWYNLRLGTQNSIKPEFTVKFSEKKIHYFDNPKDIFSPDWIDYMKNIEIEIASALVFYKPPNFVQNFAHIDGENEIFAINWTIIGKNSEMVWYDTSDSENKLEYTESDTYYFKWPVEKLTEIDRCEISTVTSTIVRVNFPHNITVRNEPRISISARTSSFKSWDSIINHLRSKDLLIERT
jgi:hypothetical protein